MEYYIDRATMEKEDAQLAQQLAQQQQEVQEAEPHEREREPEPEAHDS